MQGRKQRRGEREDDVREQGTVRLLGFAETEIGLCNTLDDKRMNKRVIVCVCVYVRGCVRVCAYVEACESGREWVRQREKGREGGQMQLKEVIVG